MQESEITSWGGSPLISFADDGDLVLLVGPEAVKIRVHSLFLTKASKPFKAMLGPDWKEGHDIVSSKGPAEISLPDDDAPSLKAICAILHHQSDTVSQSLSAVKVLRIAVVADKYDWTKAMTLISSGWLKVRENKPRDLMLLAAAAYLFRNAEAFKATTKAMVLNHGSSFLELSSEEVESAMPWKVICESYR